MTALTQLGPQDLAAALRSISGVVSDHAAALDQLDLGEPTDLDGAVESDADALAAAAEADVDGPGAGADLVATLTAVVVGCEGANDMAAVVGSFARARHACTGVAGSGLASVLDGLAEAMRNADHLDGQRLAIGLEIGAERLTPADDGRHAGGLPAVVARAADGALGALDDGAPLAEVIVAAADDGLEELEKGPTTNPSLVERGVVDAAAAGFLLVLDALASVVTGDPLPSAPLEPNRPSGVGPGHLYVVSCLVDPHEGCGLESASWLESALFDLGDLEGFDRRGARWRCEVHTTLPGTAVETILEVGHPRDLRIALVDPTGPAVR